MISFIKKHFRKIFKFCVVGSIGAVVNLLIQYVLVEGFSFYFLLGSIFGIFGGMVFNYFLNYYWTFKDDKVKVFLRLLDTLGFHRVVFERFLHPTNFIYKTQSDVLFDDGSPSGFYPSVVVPEYLKGKKLFIIEDSLLQDSLKSLGK